MDNHTPLHIQMQSTDTRFNSGRTRWLRRVGNRAGELQKKAPNALKTRDAELKLQRPGERV